MCIDYWGLNKVTKDNCYPLPLISSLLEQLMSAKVFIKLDLHNASYLVKSKKKRMKDIFCAKNSHFEYNVIPSGLMNAPTFFQHMMNAIF